MALNYIDQRRFYYEDLGYAEDKARSLANLDDMQYQQSRQEAADAQKTAQDQAATANQSFVDSLTSKLSNLFTQEQSSIQDTSSKQVQAVIDAAHGVLDSASGNGAVNSTSPQYTLPAAAAPANQGGGNTLSAGVIAAGLAAIAALWLMLKKH